MIAIKGSEDELAVNKSHATGLDPSSISNNEQSWVQQHTQQTAAATRGFYEVALMEGVAPSSSLVKSQDLERTHADRHWSVQKVHSCALPPPQFQVERRKAFGTSTTTKRQHTHFQRQLTFVTWAVFTTQ